MRTVSADMPLGAAAAGVAAADAAATLRRNLLVYGGGGILVPFVGIKLIDLVVSTIPGF